jgi:hypothetical protein
VLLNIFYLFRLDIRDEEGDSNKLFFHWDRQRWWYKLAQVCQPWRSLIFASPSRLDLHLLCTYGTPVADMLSHSPPLPLTIYYDDDFHTTAEDDEGILLALQHPDRVRRIKLALPTWTLRKVIIAMDGQFPILERLWIGSPLDNDGNTTLALPRAFKAPLLRQFALQTVSLPTRSPLLMTTVGLVLLALVDIPSSAYFVPSHLLTRLSLMPQLEKLVIRFHSPHPSYDVESQLSIGSVITHVTLPILRTFFFRGVDTYLEDLLARISAPLLNNLAIEFFNQLTFTIPRLLQFMRTSPTFNLNAIELKFSSNSFFLRWKKPRGTSGFFLSITCSHLDRQVSSAVQILSVLELILSPVEELTLFQGHMALDVWSEWHREVDRTQWRELLRPFTKVKILGVQNEFVEELARSLHSENEEMSLDILSNLEELKMSRGLRSKNGDTFTPFIQERQAAGHPVNLTMVDGSEFLGYYR